MYLHTSGHSNRYEQTTSINGTWMIYPGDKGVSNYIPHIRLLKLDLYMQIYFPCSKYIDIHTVRSAVP